MNALELRRRTLGKGVYKKTVESNPAIAQGSLARRYPGIGMQGWTEQAQYEGKNLFDASVFDGMEKSGVSVSVKDGVITASGMSESTIWIHSAKFTEEDFEKFKSGNIYMKNYKSSECNYEVGIYINNSTVKEGNSPYPIPDGYLETKPNNVYFLIDIPAGIELKGSCKPMIYQDGDGTWEPYTGGQPSPNPDYPQEIVSAGKYDEGTGKWKYEVKLTGKNLIDDSEFKYGTYYGVNITKNEDGGIRLKGTGTSNTNVYIKRNQILKDGYYSLSCKYLGLIPTVQSNLIQVYSLKTNNSLAVVNSVDNGTVVTEFLKESDDYFIRLTIIKDFQYDVVYYPMMCIDRVGCVFEPYQIPQSVTLTSDRPLTKWDKLEKRNGVWGWVYKSAEVVLDGSEDEAWSMFVGLDTEGNSFTLEFSNGVGGYQTSLCYKYRNINGAWNMHHKGEYGIYSDHSNVNIKNRYFRSPSAEIETVEQWKTWLSENPLTLWYETAEETFVPLSGTEQEQMNELYTFRPTTVLSNDCECEMTLTYKTKKSLEVTT